MKPEMYYHSYDGPVMPPEIVGTRTETANNALFARLYPELAPKFLDYEKARNIFKTMVTTRARCLELGIGSGLFSMELMDEGYQIDGLEPKGEMFKSLMKNIPARKGYKPEIFQSTIQEFGYKGDYDFLISHSGPFFFVRNEDKLHLEGLRDDQIGGTEPQRFHERLLVKLLKAAKQASGSLLFNIQEDRTDILLENDTVMFKYDRIGEYDEQRKSVVKYGRFINMENGNIMQDEKKSHFPYRRFACSLEQLQGYFNEIGDITVETRDDIWVKITPNSLME